MSSNEGNQIHSKNNLISQQLEDKEIQEILKSGTGMIEHTTQHEFCSALTIHIKFHFPHMQLDLRQYSQQIEKDLKTVENQSIDEYIKESQNIACLHNQIGDCDSILERMEAMLTNFQVSNTLLIRKC